MIVLAAGLAGAVAGAIHVVSGADHLAAVAPLATAGRRRAWRAGMGWGLGHAGGVAVMAAAAFALRAALPLEALSSWSERLVGITLIGIGLWALGRALRAARAKRGADVGHEHLHAEEGLPPGARGSGHGRPHAHRHTHGGIAHAHEHRHGRLRAAPLVGLLHGTAGGGHVVGVLPALALPSPAAAVGYLMGFGIGTVGVMTLFAAFVGVASTRFAMAGSRAWAGLLGTCGAASVAVGAFWLLPS